MTFAADLPISRIAGMEDYLTSLIHKDGSIFIRKFGGMFVGVKKEKEVR